MAQLPKPLDPINITVGRRLRLKREILGISQSALGEVIKVSRIKIGQFESGAKSIPASTLYKLSQFFKIDITFFFDNPSENSALNDLSEIDPILNRESVSLLKDYDAINNPEVQKKFAAIMERTAELAHKKKDL